jgi:hypothetical protein
MRKTSNLIAFVVTLAIFGILVPLWKGLDFLDPIMLAISANISLFFVSPLVTQGEDEQGIGRRMAWVVVFSIALSEAILGAAIATVNLTHWLGHVVMPPAKLLSGLLAFNLSAAAFLAILSGVLLRRMPPARVRRAIRTIFLVLLLAWVGVVRVAPDGIRDAFDESLTTEALARNAWIGSGILLLSAMVVWWAKFRAGRSVPT